MTAILVALLPDFLLVVTGGIMGRSLPAEMWRGIDRLNFQLLFPALIFAAALGHRPAGDDLLVIGLGVWLIIGLGFALGWLVRPMGPDRFVDFAGLWQTAWRFNTALALVVVQALPETHQALISIAIGMAVPLANLLAVGALSRGQALGPWRTARQVLTNPFFVASVAGLALSVSGLALPDVLLQAVRKLADAAIPVALLSIGASLSWRALTRVDRFSVSLNAIKLLILPAVTLAVCHLLGLDPAHVTVLTLFAALPTASAAHALASVYGADREAVATLIAQSTLLGCISLPAWMMLLA